MEQIIAIAAAIITVAVFVGLCYVVASIMVKNDQRDRMRIDGEKIRQIKLNLA